MSRWIFLFVFLVSIFGIECSKTTLSGARSKVVEINNEGLEKGALPPLSLRNMDRIEPVDVKQTKIDILLVKDNSASMEDENNAEESALDGVINNIGILLNKLSENEDIDYRIAVTSMTSQGVWPHHKEEGKWKYYKDGYANLKDPVASNQNIKKNNSACITTLFKGGISTETGEKKTYYSLKDYKNEEKKSDCGKNGEKTQTECDLKLSLGDQNIEKQNAALPLAAEGLLSTLEALNLVTQESAQKVWTSYPQYQEIVNTRLFGGEEKSTTFLSKFSQVSCDKTVGEDSWYRPDAKLIIIFFSDEDNCGFNTKISTYEGNTGEYSAGCVPYNYYKDSTEYWKDGYDKSGLSSVFGLATYNSKTDPKFILYYPEIKGKTEIRRYSVNTKKDYSTNTRLQNHDPNKIKELLSNDDKLTELLFESAQQWEKNCPNMGDGLCQNQYQCALSDEAYQASKINNSYTCTYTKPETCEKKFCEASKQDCPAGTTKENGECYKNIGNKVCPDGRDECLDTEKTCPEGTRELSTENGCFELKNKVCKKDDCPDFSIPFCPRIYCKKSEQICPVRLVNEKCPVTKVCPQDTCSDSNKALYCFTQQSQDQKSTCLANSNHQKVCLLTTCDISKRKCTQKKECPVDLVSGEECPVEEVLSSKNEYTPVNIVAPLRLRLIGQRCESEKPSDQNKCENDRYFSIKKLEELTTEAEKKYTGCPNTDTNTIPEENQISSISDYKKWYDLDSSYVNKVPVKERCIAGESHLTDIRLGKNMCTFYRARYGKTGNNYTNRIYFPRKGQLTSYDIGMTGRQESKDVFLEYLKTLKGKHNSLDDIRIYGVLNTDEDKFNSSVRASDTYIEVAKATHPSEEEKKDAVISIKEKDYEKIYSTIYNSLTRAFIPDLTSEVLTENVLSVVLGKVDEKGNFVELQKVPQDKYHVTGQLLSFDRFPVDPNVTHMKISYSVVN